MPPVEKGGPDNAIGRSHGGLSTKIHALVDQDGLPIRILITEGKASDKTIAPQLIEGLPPAKALVADKGDDSWPLVDFIARTGGHAHIPTRRHVKAKRLVDPALYRERNRIERFFCRLKQFRRAATRFDKLARNFLATLAIAAIRLWLRHVESTP